jgi:hypothetical protein
MKTWDVTNTVGAIALISILALASTSCHKPIAAMVGQPFELPVRRAAHLSKTDLDLYFRRVVADSRCPVNAQCVTAGFATVALEGRILKGPAESFEVHLPGGAAPDDSIPWKPYDGYRIRLLRLDPAPVAGSTPDTTGYVATLIVEKR